MTDIRKMLRAGNVTLDDCTITDDHWGHLWFRAEDSLGTARWCNGKGVFITRTQALVLGPEDKLLVLMPERSTAEEVNRCAEVLVERFGPRVVVSSGVSVAVLKDDK